RAGLDAEVVRRARPAGVEVCAGRDDEREIADRRTRAVRLAAARTERGVGAVAELAGLAHVVAARRGAGAIALAAAGARAGGGAVALLGALDHAVPAVRTAGAVRLARAGGTLPVTRAAV